MSIDNLSQPSSDEIFLDEETEVDFSTEEIIENELNNGHKHLGEIFGNKRVRQLMQEAIDKGLLRRDKIDQLWDNEGLDPAEIETFEGVLKSAGVDFEEPGQDTRTLLARGSNRSTDALQIFLTEAGRHPLLTAQLEVELSKKREIGEVAAELKKLEEKTQNNHLPLTEEELLRKQELSNEVLRWAKRNPTYIRNYQESGTKIVSLDELIREGELSKQRMIQSNLRLVVSIAKPYRGYAEQNGLDFLDLIQEGTLGLTRAVEKFDWRRGYKFSTYATWWIKQATQRALHNLSRTIRVPVHVSERKTKLHSAEKRLWQMLGRGPTRLELAEETNLSLEYVEGALDAAHVHASLNKHIGEEEESELGDMFADGETLDPFEEAEESLRSSQIRAALKSLPERERQVMELRFGFAGGEPWTLEAIGHELGLTRERVRQIENQTLAKLHSNSELRKALLPEELVPAKLSPREVDVIKLLAEGKTNSDIAQILNISFYTVQQHRKTGYRKLGVRTASSAVKKLEINEAYWDQRDKRVG